MKLPVGRVFDIQHYAVHDGPGIRTIVFLKGCPLRCPWCCNPESHHAASELRHLAHRCQACGHCVEACPSGAVRLNGDSARFDRRPCPACDAPCVSACAHAAIERVGVNMTVHDVVARVDADRDFYRNSNGGVTFSGGEPFAQPEFLEAAAEACRDRQLHVAVETSGYAPEPVFQAVARHIDLFLFDLKFVDIRRHRAVTGVDNVAILENLLWLASTRPADVIVRFAAIPGYTDDESNVDAVAGLMNRCGLKKIEVTAFHPLGREKYEMLGHPPPAPIDPTAMDDAALARVRDRFARAGLSAGVS